MIKAMIFDMDGVIADTEPIHEQSRNVMLAEFGLDVETISPTAIGRSKREFWGEVAEKYSLPYTADQLTVREFEVLLDLIQRQGLECTNGLEDLLKELQRRGITSAVASSSDRIYVTKILEITNLKKYFSAVACGNEVAVAKPAPDVYLRALELCGVEAECAVAVEDSDTGAKAAKAAKMFCIGYDCVSDAQFRQKLDMCDVKVNKMQEIVSMLPTLLA